MEGSGGGSSCPPLSAFKERARSVIRSASVSLSLSGVAGLSWACSDLSIVSIESGAEGPQAGTERLDSPAATVPLGGGEVSCPGPARDPRSA
jgi:hypothetical protein